MAGPWTLNEEVLRQLWFLGTQGAVFAAREAMARAELLLRFPPAAEQMDEWRASIQSLLDFAEAEGSR